MSINTILPLDDIGLFKTPRGRESKSQYQRAVEIRDQFAHCMRNALNGNGCVMPQLCANGDPRLKCIHLDVDYRNFTGSGIPLTGRARKLIDERLRAIGTIVYRGGEDYRIFKFGHFPGDIHIPSLQRISQFTGTPRRSRRPAAKKSGGWLSRLFG